MGSQDSSAGMSGGAGASARDGGRGGADVGGAAGGPSGRGLVMVYTGNGKGKTTAALGLALRAVGHGRRVLMLQFMKGGGTYGECTAARMLPGFEIVQKGLPSFVDRDNPDPESLRLAGEAVAMARDALTSGRWDLVILDELNVALDFGLVTLEDVLSLLDARRPDIDVVLTGRRAHPEVVSRADLVSEVLEVKHHYRQGIPARKGIEY
jgi:cob(I)alamin adenosyltransferase